MKYFNYKYISAQKMDSEQMARKIREAEELPPADIKLILLGDSAVGKSKLTERFLLND
jgi:GTPase SAR1 family protein